MPESNQQNEYALTNFPSSEHPPISHSRASLLRGYRQRNERPEQDHLNTNRPQSDSRTGILARLSFFMSRNPLLSRSVSTQGTGSYGLIPNFNATNEAPGHGADGIKERDRSKAKSSAVGADATGSSHSGRYRHRSRSSSRDTENGIGHITEGDEGGNSGEEAINVDGDDSDENPPDNSP